MLKIKLEHNQQRRVFITSDTHYSHANICRGTSTWSGSDLTRDFKTLEDMNQALVDNINRRVHEDDILIHLGDWSFGGFDKIAEFRSKLNVSEIHLVLGNHDHHILNDKENIRSIFSSVNEGILNMRLSIENEDKSTKKYFFVLCHYPIASWENMDRRWVHLHGHVHLRPHQIMGEGRHMDVGVDGSPDLSPYNIMDVIDLMKGKTNKTLTLPSDHHQREAK